MKITPGLLFCFLFFCNVNAQTAFPLSDWMAQTLDKEKTLQQITLPGAHDASIARCFDCTIGANVRNTQTQYLPIENLLDSGIRYFDLRPVLDREIFYTGHYTKYNRRPSFGCKGDTMKRIFSAVNNFLEQHNELVILHFSHYCDRSWKDLDSNFLSAFLELMEENLGEKIFKLTDPKKRMATLPLKEILNGKKGKVIILVNNFEGKAISDPARGIFSPAKDINLFDKYSNSRNADEMIADQELKFDKWSVKDSLTREELFVMPWTLTQNAKYAMRCAGIKWPWKKCRSIMKMAEEAKAKLPQKISEYVASGKFRRNRKPAVINVDLADGLVTRLCVRLNNL
jgi:hypothetical protein